MTRKPEAHGLHEAVERFVRLNPRVRDPKTVSHYRSTVDLYGRFLGRRPTTDDLTDDSVVLWMSRMVAEGNSAVSANHRRKNLIALWNWLARRGEVNCWPSVPKMAEPRRIPRAWTQDQLGRLIGACRKMPGMIGGYAAASDWWLGFHGIAWDTGARATEILLLEWGWLDRQSGVLHVPAEARKGKRSDAVYRLAPDTLEVLGRLDRGAPKIFHGMRHPTSLWRAYDRVLKVAGLPAGRYSKPQKMRRTHASWLAVSGGDATSSLGHSSDVVTRASYLDPTICQPAPATSLFRILSGEVRQSAGGWGRAGTGESEGMADDRDDGQEEKRETG